MSKIESQEQRAVKKAADSVEKIVKGAITTYDDRLKFGKTGAKINSIDKNKFGEGTFASAKDETPDIDLNSLGKGTYNRIKKPDMTGMERTVVETGKSLVADSEAAQGYYEVKRKAALFGVGTATRSAQRRYMEDMFYNRKGIKYFDRKDSEKENKKTKNPSTNEKLNPDDIIINESTLKNQFGDDYRIGVTRTGNMMNDYRSNLRTVEKYLEDNGINAKSLSLNKIKQGIDEGQLKKIGHNNSVKLGIEERLALKEYFNLRQVGAQINHYRQMGGGLKNTAKAWGQELLQDSDVYKGYRTAETIAITAKATAWAGRGAGALMTNTAVTAVEMGAKAGIGVARAGAKTAGKISKVSVGDGAATKKWQAIDTKLGRASDKVSVGSANIKKNVNTIAKARVSDGVKWIGKNTIGHTQAAKSAAAMMEKIRTNKMLRRFQNRMLKVTRVVRAPAAAINAIKGAVTKVLLIGAGAILLVVVLDAVMISILSFFPQAAEPVNNNVDNSIAQRTIDYLYNYHEAYEENIYQCEAGSIYADKGIPSTWTLYDASDFGGTDTVHDPLTAVYENGKLIGYNLHHYWGPADREYVDYVYVGHWIPGDDQMPGYWEYTLERMTLIGVGGLEYDMGTYSTLYSPVDKGSQAYQNLYVKENEDLTVNFHYKGSSYSYQLTSSKSSTYNNSTGEIVHYSIDSMYKAFMSMMISYTENNDECYEFISAYCKEIFDKVMEDAVLTLDTTFQSDPSQTAVWTYIDPESGRITDCSCSGYRAHVSLNVYFDDAGLQDIIALDPVDNAWSHNNGSTGVYEITDQNQKGYTYWDGWFEGLEKSDAHDTALEYFELTEDDWEEIMQGVTFPGNTCQNLTGSDVIDMVSQIEANNGGLSSDRKEFIEFALSCVGRYYYKYGSGHPINDLDNPPTGMDCSAFVSYALYMGGVDDTYKDRNANMLAKDYTSVPFDGYYADLEPGTIIVKNNIPGGTSTSSNHVVIYLGFMELEGDSAPRAYCVECTTTTDKEGRSISGVQLSSSNRLVSISNYNYARDPFQ